MTKKDYELIAGVIVNNFSGYGDDDSTVTRLVNDFANALKLNNPKFDRGKFLTACGIESEKHAHNCPGCWNCELGL